MRLMRWLHLLIAWVVRNWINNDVQLYAADLADWL
jgi:hypothetical protein